MFTIIFICGFLITLLLSNLLIFIIDKLFNHFNYKLTIRSRYLLSFFIILIIGVFIGYAIIHIIL